MSDGISLGNFTVLTPQGTSLDDVTAEDLAIWNVKMFSIVITRWVIVPKELSVATNRNFSRR